MINNSHSYYYTELNFNNGLFDGYVDMVYVLTMEDSTRTNHFMEQLSKYKLLSTVTIQINKGFHKVNKQLYCQNSIFDINDAFYYCFLHAKQHNFKNIIILEDDFYFDSSLTSCVVNDIGNFINNNIYDVYNFGPIMHLSIPSFSKHHRCLFMAAAHCCIYSSKYMDFYINCYNNILPIRSDFVWNQLGIIKYKYYKPICFQLFTETKNQKQWITPIAKLGIFLFRLDKSYYGFHLINIGIYLGIVFFPIIIIIVYYLYKTQHITKRLVS